jgi:hypothetical protein
VDVTTASTEEREAWVKVAAQAEKAMSEQTRRIEGMDMGIAEAGETRYKDAVDLLQLHHQQAN